MKKLLTSLVIITLSISTALAYELSVEDRNVLQTLKPILEKKYMEDSKSFEGIVARIDDIYSVLRPNTRSYELLSQLKGIMEGIKNRESILTLIKVVDGDTVILNNSRTSKNTNYRLIGIDAPEISTLRYGEVGQYGKESTEYLQEISSGGNISVEYDDSQGKTDKYERHLVYLFSGMINLNQEMISKGYAKEYTYDTPYKYQSEFRQAEEQAKENKSGVWSLEGNEETHTYSGFTDTESDGVCNIKGNIGSNDEKIYHYEGCQSYTKTKISPEKGEKYFCSTKEAEDAGWRVAGNCN